MSTSHFGDAAGWNQRYAGEAYLFGCDPNDHLRAQAHRLRLGARVLCVADGEGRNSVWLAQALKPGGVLILQGCTPKQLDHKTGGPGELSHLYTEAQVREAFAALRIDELVSCEAELNEGARHVGRSALLGQVAVKPDHSA